MQAGSTIGGRFVIEGRAAGGGMGTVYRARDRASGKRVALKVLDNANDNQYARFEREVELLQRLANPGIVQHVAHGREPSGRAYLALEWLEGEDLEVRLARGPLGVTSAVALVRRIAEVLAVVHAHGVVHRDLKPANVFLVDGSLDEPRLLDFGIARYVGHSVTRTGALLGTPQYMAPEQVRGQHDIDARSDVFALGVVLFECIVGQPPFVSDTVMGAMGRILFEEAPQLGELAVVPAELESLCASMLEKEPSRRPNDAAAVARALAAMPMDVDPLLAIRPRITAREQRFACVLLTGATGASSDVDRSSPHAVAAAERAETLVDTSPRSIVPPSRAVELPNGARALSVFGTGTAFDTAAKVARSALRLRGSLGQGVPIAVATGRSSDGVVVVGPAIDRANDLLAAPTTGVRLDDMTAGLLDVRFDVGADERGFYLRGERDFDLGVRTLLGRTTRCFGRSREIQTLLDTYDECIEESSSRVAMLVGAPGVGKTRVAYEVVTALRARAERPGFLRARGDVMAEGSPFGLLSDLVRHTLGLAEDEPLEAARRRLAARVESSVPETEAARIAAFLGELCGLDFPDTSDAGLPAAREDPMLMGDQLRRAFADFVLAECARRPFVILIDDLQWGDAPSIQALDHALRLAASLPLFVLALARPEVKSLFPNLWDDRHPQTLALAPLTRRALTQLSEHVLGIAATPDLVENIVARSQGNAFFAEELLRGIASGRTPDTPLPTVLALAEARILGLESEARRILRAASIFGDAFWPSGISALLGGVLDASEVYAVLTDLVDDEIVSRSEPSRFAGEPQFGFRHDLLREACLSMLTPEDLVLGHGLAARWLEQSGETDAILLAKHSSAGGERRVAAAWWTKAAEEALAGGDWPGALERSERALESDPEPAVRIRAELVSIEVLGWQGDGQRAFERASALASVLEAGSRPWISATLWLLQSALRAGERDRLDDLVESVVEVLPSVLDDALRDQASYAPFLPLLRIANMLLSLGFSEKTRTIVDLVTSRTALDRLKPIERAYLTGAVGRLERDPWRMVQAAHQAMLYFEASGDLRRAAGMRLNQASSLLVMGAYDEVEPIALDGRRMSEQLAITGFVADFDSFRARRLAALGQIDEAVELQSRAMMGAGGSQRIALQVKLGELWLQAGKPEKALVHARSALENLPLDSPLTPFALAIIARAELARQKPHQALPFAKNAHALLRERGVIDEGGQQVALALIETLQATGDTAGARRALCEARTDLERRAARIGSELHRRSFLERVPENREILALAKALGV